MLLFVKKGASSLYVLNDSERCPHLLREPVNISDILAPFPFLSVKMKKLVHPQISLCRRKTTVNGNATTEAHKSNEPPLLVSE
jgi:hypothetical protein